MQNKEQRKLIDKKYRETHKEQIKLKKQSLHGRFMMWKFWAKKKNKEFSVTEEYLSTLSTICAYSGI